MKKYFYKVTDQNGNVIFNHKSDYAYKLIKMADKASRGSDGAIYINWYFAKVETNITNEIIYKVDCGYKI